MKITHIITGLPAHGAEIMLYQMLLGWDRSEDDHEVVSLTDRGSLADRIETLGVPVRTLGMRRGIPNPLAIRKLALMLKESGPDLIHCWMYHANLMGAFAARALGNTPTIWSIHHTSISFKTTKPLTVLTAKICAWLSSRIPARIVCCSEATRQAHAGLGYDDKKMVTIPNGIDLNKYRPNPTERLAFRKVLGIPSDAFVIGLAARFHPHKDHETFLAAASRFQKRFQDVHFLLCGDQVDGRNSNLVAKVNSAGLGGRCHLLGTREDMPSFYAALDIAVNSSLSEAFPLSIGEAMACRVPCVVTDVGDCSIIVGNTGKIVRRQDPEALAAAYQELLELGIDSRRKLGAAARERVASKFSLRAAIDKYHELYTEVLARRLIRYDGLKTRSVPLSRPLLESDPEIR